MWVVQLQLIHIVGCKLVFTNALANTVFQLIQDPGSQKDSWDIWQKLPNLSVTGCSTQCLSKPWCQGFIHYRNESSCAQVMPHNQEETHPMTQAQAASLDNVHYLNANLLRTSPTLFVALGHNRNTKLHVYSQTGGCFGDDMNFPLHDTTMEAFHRQAGGYHQGIMLFCGGAHESGGADVEDNAKDNCYFIDLAQRPLIWNTSLKLPQNRVHGMFVGVGDKMYLVGGKVIADSPDNSMLAFDMNTQTIGRIKDSNGNPVEDSEHENVKQFCALEVENRYILMIGGNNVGQSAYRDQVNEFDTVAKTWKPLPSLSRTRANVMCGLVTLDSEPYIMAFSSDSGSLTTAEFLPAYDRSQPWITIPRFESGPNMKLKSGHQVIQNKPNGEVWMMNSLANQVLTMYPNGSWTETDVAISDVTFTLKLAVPTKYFMDGPCLPFLQ